MSVSKSNQKTHQCSQRITLDNDHKSTRFAIYTPPPNTVNATQLSHFSAIMRDRLGGGWDQTQDFHAMTVRCFREFWQVLLAWSGLIVAGNPKHVCVGERCEDAVFFPELTLNYAENLLASDDVERDLEPAIISHHADGAREEMSRHQLRRAVLRLSGALRTLGLRPGDRVGMIARNNAEAVVAALAVAAAGGVLATAAPDLGVGTIVSRFGQISAKILIAHVKSQPHDTGSPVSERIGDVVKALSSVERLVVLDGGIVNAGDCPVHHLTDMNGDPQSLERFSFNHPLFIMFSSGTTGRPKCIVHGAGGTLLEHVKEHRLHCDLHKGDRLFFHTSCAWMMWQWQLSALASGVAIVLYDGPITAASTLWRIVAEEKVTVFGTSPPYLKLCESRGYSPRGEVDLRALRAVLSTGSVLLDQQYHWVHLEVGNLPLQSISGGTDIIGCFVLGNPNLPVNSGECQSRSFGLDVRAATELGELASRPGAMGELVCVNPFPSRPLGLFGDDDGTRFHAAYFARNGGVWSHGDQIEITASGGVRIHGRCDGVLNVRGIRIGPAEVYRILQDISEVQDALLVQQEAGENRDERTVLLVTLRSSIRLDRALNARILQVTTAQGSAAHAPDLIIQLEELPTTYSGKFSESAATDAVNGRPLRNAEAIRNPWCLEPLRGHPQLTDCSPVVAEADINNIERWLMLQWEDLLGLSPITEDDNFFDLGGHSLLVARLLARVQDVIGRDLPLNTLLRAPTVRELAALLRDETELPSSRVVLLRQGDTDRALFLVHSMTGNVLQMYALVRALDTDRAVYGIQARGLTEAEEPHRHVEAMAAEYLELIRAVQPQGPYLLGGYSFGGLVAFEMAHCLTQVGETVERLILLDTRLPDLALHWHERLRLGWRRVQYHARNLRATPAELRFTLAKTKLGALLGRFRLRVGGAGDGRLATEVPLAMRRVSEGLWLAYWAYRPKPYPGRVILFRAAEPPPQGRKSMWERFALGGVDFHTALGEHDTMLLPANVPTLAYAMARLLNAPDVPNTSPCRPLVLVKSEKA